MMNLCHCSCGMCVCNNFLIFFFKIAGHERFGAMTRVYYKFAIAAVVCFDISRPSTLDNVKKWRDGAQFFHVMLGKFADKNKAVAYKNNLKSKEIGVGLVKMFNQSCPLFFVFL